MDNTEACAIQAEITRLITEKKFTKLNLSNGRELMEETLFWNIYLIHAIFIQADNISFPAFRRPDDVRFTLRTHTCSRSSFFDRIHARPSSALFPIEIHRAKLTDL